MGFFYEDTGMIFSVIFRFSEQFARRSSEIDAQGEDGQQAQAQGAEAAQGVQPVSLGHGASGGGVDLKSHFL